jgi:HK97 family phage major capsid protein
MKFELKKIMGMAYADIEIIEDSPITIQTMLQSDFADAFAMAMDDGMLNGTGAGDLLGVMNSPCLVSVTIEIGQTLAGDPIMFENINTMYAHLPNMSKRRAVWSINPDMTPKLPLMNLSVGSGGSAVFLPVGGASGAPFSTLYGRPIIENECCQALGTKGDIVLGDWSYYALVRKSSGSRFETSIHFKFDTDEMTYKWAWRMDGKPLWYNYKTPRRGAMTRTPFVTLDART